MLRIGMLVAICAGLPGCASVEKAINDKAKEVIASRKIPEVKLTPEQVALLKKPAENSRVAWIKAGTQADGKVFACYVTLTPNSNIFGYRRKDFVSVQAGVFEGGDMFKELSTPLVEDHGFFECRDRGIDPPVRKVLRDRFDFSGNR